MATTDVYFRRETHNGLIRRCVTISRPGREDVLLWAEVPEQYADWLTTHDDPLLILAIYPIMEQGGECRIHAEVDRVLLENLTEFMRIWRLWCPGACLFPTLTADALLDRESSASRAEAICAFSGGVDAAFTLCTHVSGHWGPLSLKVPAAVMIHGADIYLHQQAEFDCAFSHAEAALRPLGVELVPLRTNFREYAHNWSLSHYSVVVAALSLFGGRFCRGLMGSDFIASTELISASLPYGMNYVTDHLFNSSTFTSRPVGCDSSRTERCEFISHFPSIMEHLRVCWQNREGRYNCGICEKCIRTALNFMALGYRSALPFSETFTLEHLKRLNIRSHFEHMALTDILSVDRQTQALPDDIRSMLQKKLKKADPSFSRAEASSPGLCKLRFKALRYRLLSALTKDKRQQKYQRKLEITLGQIRHKAGTNK